MKMLGEFCENYIIILRFKKQIRIKEKNRSQDEAFESLDQALLHAKAFDKICDGEEHYLTAPLVSYVEYNAGIRKDISKRLADEWPFWCNPDYSQVEKEIKADSRWKRWVAKTQA